MERVAGSLDELTAETSWLRALARSLIQDRAEADDLAHDAYELAARKAPPGDAARRPWLGRVMVNLVRTRRRAILRRGLRERATGELAAAPATPAELVERVETHRMLAELVLALPPTLRDVVMLRYVEGLSSAAIGNRLGIAAGTVRWRLTQALDELRAALDAREPRRAWAGALGALAGEPARGTIVLGAVAAAVLAAAVVLAVAVRSVALGTLAAPATVAPREPGAAQEPSLDGAPAKLEVASSMFAMWSGARVEPLMLAGTVVDGAGRPVADASVSVEVWCNYGTDAIHAVRTAGDGRFAVEVEPACSYYVAASRDGAAARQRIVDMRPYRESRPPLVLALAPEDPIAMTVIDAATGAPIAGATIDLGDGRTLRSGADGGATFALAAARRVAVRMPGYATEKFGTIGVWPGLPDRLFRDRDPRQAIVALRDELRAVKLTRGAVEVIGTVVDRRGQPVGGISVTVRDRELAVSEVGDARGAFRMWVPAGRTWSVRAQPLSLDLPLRDPRQVRIDGPVHHLRVELEDTIDLAGVVLDRAGKPAAGARVTSTQHAFRAVTTDAAGRFAIPLVRCSKRRGITVIARLGEQASAPHWIPESGCAPEPELVLTLDDAGVRGIMVDGDGAPVAGGYVRFQRTDALEQLMVRTGHDGRFAIDTPGGPHELFAYRSPDPDVDDEVVLDVRGGDHDVRIVVP